MNTEILGNNIKNLIEKNNETIRAILDPNVFTLNNTVKELLQQNAELQEICPHNFVDGYCVYCCLEEEKA